jgi:three-Cys-motif partner protein
MREWQYWTRSKLSILAGYLPRFQRRFLKEVPERLYIDLMAGEPLNRDSRTGEEFDGSARLALSSVLPFTRIALCETPQKDAALKEDLSVRYPDWDFEVYPGDCNETIGRVLAALACS